jgi:hypothetical protein
MQEEVEAVWGEEDREDSLESLILITSNHLTMISMDSRNLAES